MSKLSLSQVMNEERARLLLHLHHKGCLQKDKQPQQPVPPSDEFRALVIRALSLQGLEARSVVRLPLDPKALQGLEARSVVRLPLDPKARKLFFVDPELLSEAASFLTLRERAGINRVCRAGQRAVLLAGPKANQVFPLKLDRAHRDKGAHEELEISIPLELLMEYPSSTHFSLKVDAEVSDLSFCRLIQNVIKPAFRHLSAFKLMQGINVTDESLPVVARAWPRLTSFRVNFCPKLTYKGLKALGKSCPTITDLELLHAPWMTSKPTLALLQESFSRVRTLSLWATAEMTNTSFLRALHKSHPELEELSFFNSPIATNFTLTGSELFQIGSIFPQLQGLGLIECQRIYDRDLDTTLFCLLPGLRRLAITGCSNVGKQGMQAIVKHLPLLERLVIDQTANIDSTSILLLKNAEKLTYLSLANHRAATDELLWLLGMACSHLTTLDLAFNLGITSKGLDAFITHCKGIQKIDITGCSQFHAKGASEKDFEALKKKHRHVDFMRGA